MEPLKSGDDLPKQSNPSSTPTGPTEGKLKGRKAAEATPSKNSNDIDNIQKKALNSVPQGNTSQKKKPILKKAPKKNEDALLEFDAMVQHRLSYGQQQGEKYIEKYNDRKNLQLVDEPLAGGFRKDSISKEEADQAFAEWDKIDKLTKQGLPKGKAPVGSRKNRSLTEKAQTRRPEAKIRSKANSPSWQDRYLETIAEKAKERIAADGAECTSAGMVVYMDILNSGEDVFTLDEMRELVFSIKIDQYYHHKATPEQPGTPHDITKNLEKFNPSVQEIINILKSELKIESINEQADGTFRLKYKRVPFTDIMDYIQKMFQKDD